ncbi:MAG: hypothetical protein V4850_31785 [Myxococcota bacterium]
MLIFAWVLGCSQEKDEAGPTCTQGYGDDFRNGHFYGAPQSYGNAKVVAGFVSTEIGDIDYTNGDAHLSTFHHRDADADEDGEIEGLYIFLSSPANACDLRLRSNSLPVIDDLSITIESDCAGWTDAQEDGYEWNEASPATVEVDHRVTGDVAEACFETELRPEGVVQLESYSGTMTVDLSSFVIEGAVYSYAIPEEWD